MRYQAANLSTIRDKVITRNVTMTPNETTRFWMPSSSVCQRTTSVLIKVCESQAQWREQFPDVLLTAIKVPGRNTKVITLIDVASCFVLHAILCMSTVISSICVTETWDSSASFLLASMLRYSRTPYNWHRGWLLVTLPWRLCSPVSCSRLVSRRVFQLEIWF